VPVALVHVFDTPDVAFSALTQYRRRIRRKHRDNENLGLIFNDYMNGLMGDPTDEKIMALVEPALKAGAEFFVIDCGWYADDSGWWDDVACGNLQNHDSQMVSNHFSTNSEPKDLFLEYGSSQR
jgi:alpha-galactosidase